MAAKTAVTPARAVLGLGALGLAGFGAYYVAQNAELVALAAAKQELETKVFVAQGKARRAESRVLETESLIKALQQQTELGLKSEADIELELTAARQAVARLEEQQAQKREDLQRLKYDFNKAQVALEDARREAVRFKQDAAAADHSLQQASAQLVAARERLNPLQHPAIKEFFKSSGKR
jgi:hypothetical protein